MQTIKPDDSLLVKTLTAFLRDVGKQFQVTALDTQRDTAYVLRRLEREGISFVTKTLPSFGKHLDRCLANGKYTPFPSFRKDRNGALPLILRGLTCEVFSNDGTLLDTPDCDAIRLLRQFAFMYYKVDGEYPPALVESCIRKFVEVDNSLTSCDSLTPDKYGYIYQTQLIIEQLFKDFNPLDIIPDVGPGQCSTRQGHEERYKPSYCYQAIHEVYHFGSYYYVGMNHLQDALRKEGLIPKAPAGVSRLATVPKDSRGPRIICMEPHEYMWFQQGLRRAMVEHIERHPITAGHVNFTSQQVNRDLALSSSRTGLFATLDMKEASDRISKDLVEELFHNVPKLRDALLALTTDGIVLPDGTYLRKRKFAPMGSSLCFPIMSIVHFALGCAAVMLHTNVSLQEAKRKIYVYGDDIIVARDTAQILFEVFPLFDLVFNKDKSFTDGHFRESCGVDAYRGVDVTPLRVKTRTISRRKPASLVTALAYFHGFFNRGLWECAKVWQTEIERHLGSLPRVSKKSALLGWIVPISVLTDANQYQYDKKLQSPCLRGWQIKSIQLKSMIGCWERLLRSQVTVKEDDSSILPERDRIKLIRKRVPLSGL